MPAYRQGSISKRYCALGLMLKLNSNRYFEGVQNDKTRQGELFGIKVRILHIVIQSACD